MNAIIYSPLIIPSFRLDLNYGFPATSHQPQKHTPLYRRKIDPEHVKLILEAGLLSPTSKASRAWQFVVVEDSDMLSRLADCKSAGAMPVAKCPLAVVVAVDTTSTDPWIEDGSVAASFMMLELHPSVWVHAGFQGSRTLHSRQYPFGGICAGSAPECLRLRIPVCILTFGHKDEDRKPQDLEKTQMGECPYSRPNLPDFCDKKPKIVMVGAGNVASHLCSEALSFQEHASGAGLQPAH